MVLFSGSNELFSFQFWFTASTYMLIIDVQNGFICILKSSFHCDVLASSLFYLGGN